jgi:hypothetical protein
LRFAPGEPSNKKTNRHPGEGKEKEVSRQVRESCNALQIVKLQYRRPNVSIVKTAGSAKIQLIKPKPRDDKSADTWEKPAWTNMVDE